MIGKCLYQFPIDALFYMWSHLLVALKYKCLSSSFSLINSYAERVCSTLDCILLFVNFKNKRQISYVMRATLSNCNIALLKSSSIWTNAHINRKMRIKDERKAYIIDSITVPSWNECSQCSLQLVPHLVRKWKNFLTKGEFVFSVYESRCISRSRIDWIFDPWTGNEILPKWISIRCQWLNVPPKE